MGFNQKEAERLLADTGRTSEAIHEALICLRLNEQFEAAKRLIEELSIVPVSRKDDNLVP